MTVHQQQIQIDRRPTGGEGGHGQRQHEDATSLRLRLFALLLVGQLADQRPLAGDDPSDENVDDQRYRQWRQVLGDEHLDRQQEGEVKVHLGQLLHATDQCPALERLGLDALEDGMGHGQGERQHPDAQHHQRHASDGRLAGGGASLLAHRPEAMQRYHRHGEGGHVHARGLHPGHQHTHQRAERPRDGQHSHHVEWNVEHWGRGNI